MTLYEVLGVDRGADAAAIKAAYRARARTLHPDAGGDAAAFTQLQQAYDILSDAGLRQRYDETGVVPGAEAAVHPDAPLYAELAGLLLQLAGAGGPAALMARIRDRLAVDLAAMDAEIRASENLIAMAKRVARGISCRWGENDLGAAVDAQVQAFEAGLTAQRYRRARQVRRIELLSSYDFETIVEAPAMAWRRQGSAT